MRREEYETIDPSLVEIRKEWLKYVQQSRKWSEEVQEIKRYTSLAELIKSLAGDKEAIHTMNEMISILESSTQSRLKWMKALKNLARSQREIYRDIISFIDRQITAGHKPDEIKKVG